MGLWMIQSVRRELAPDQGFGTICDNASKETIPSIVDANDDRFLAPKNMTEEVQKACAESGQPVPEGISQVAAVIYNSLAKCYAKTVEELEEITGVHYPCIHIVGGGANADYLNRLTAKGLRPHRVRGTHRGHGHRKYRGPDDRRRRVCRSGRGEGVHHEILRHCGL